MHVEEWNWEEVLHDALWLLVKSSHFECFAHEEATQRVFVVLKVELINTAIIATIENAPNFLEFSDHCHTTRCIGHWWDLAVLDTQLALALLPDQNESYLVLSCNEQVETLGDSNSLLVPACAHIGALKFFQACNWSLKCH